MKKYLLTVALTGALSLAAAMTALAGWESQGDTWKYRNTDGTYAAGNWYWLDGNGDQIAECYYFDGNGIMLANTTTPDGYTVDASGAWTVNSVVQTKNLTPVEGWNDLGTQWKYWLNGRFVKSAWKNIDGKRYYFDENEIMAAGFQHIDGDEYYFGDDGALVTTSFTLDGIRYKVNSKGVITDEMDEFDWFTGNYKDDDDDDNDSISNYNDDYYSNDDSDSIYSDNEESGDMDNYAFTVFEIVNRRRSENDRDSLEWDDDLAAAAQERAGELVEKYSHVRPDGTLWKTILDEYGIHCEAWAENIAFGYKTPEDAMKAWMNSSGHKKNILNSRYKKIGVGFYYYDGQYYWVQNFTS